MGFEVLVKIGLKWIVKKHLVALERNKKVFGKRGKFKVLEVQGNDFCEILNVLSCFVF